MNKALYIICAVIGLLIHSGFAAQDALTILSWNVFQRPAILSDHQQDRVGATAEVLLNSNADVLCLQEVFRKKTQRQLIELLAQEYPYFIGPGKGGLVKTSSGLMIFSKEPFQETSSVEFKAKRKSDALARKGAQCIELNGYGIVNTHLQSGQDSLNQAVRNEQYAEIYQAILSNNGWQNYWVCGDLNTKYSNHTNRQIMEESMHVQASHKVDSKLQFSANFSDNGLYPFEGGEPERIDFIMPAKTSKWTRKSIHISRPQSNWGGKTNYLSDHAMLISTFVLEVE